MRLRRPRLSNRIVVAAVFAVTMFMSIMDSTIVNVALPAVARDFGVGVGSIDGIVTSYLVSLAVAIPASGWLGDRFGTKRLFVGALALFTLSSALCGTATGLGQLVVYRVLQGVGGGLLTPVGMTMLYRAFPPEARRRAAQVLVLPTVLAPAVGPVVGGLLVDQASWHWVFLVNVPVGLAALVFGLLFLREHREEAVGRFDAGGFLLSASGFALVLYGLSVAPSRGWGSPRVLGALLVGAALTAAMVGYELRRAEPLIALRLLGNRLFRAANLTSTLSTAAFLGLLFLVPLFLQDARGESALTSGLTTFPEAVGVILSTQVVGRIYPAVGPRRLMAGGLVFVGAMMATFASVGQGTSLWFIRVLMFLVGAGMAFVFMPLQTAAFATVSPADTGQAAGLFNAQRQLASAVGIAALSTALAAFRPAGAALATPAGVTAFSRTFLVAAGVAWLGAAVALTVPDRDATNTMTPAGQPGVPAEAAAPAT